MSGRSQGIRFPCAWLEQDGFFDPVNNFVSKTPFVQSRSKCKGRAQCAMNWLPINSAHALTFKLIGTDDMHDYLFQAHFCYPVYEAQHSHCTKQEGEVAFTMRQIGTWLTLSTVFCRCTQPAEVSSISYARGVKPSDTVFRGVFYEMTCTPMRECKSDESCYIETPNSDGLLYGGKVMCTCPKKTFCPIYFIRGKRIPFVNSQQRITHYGLKCKQRSY
ncbi:unnamed protein product [Mesocestoides corti]|uniref:DUF5731 domain-containing protein n=1 Tax=Mesocestoides corti TaxID=53468 RepID=A0A0R3UML6_MESCO|nr:unnamed protein product [Mesocestoides corti]